jgi:hypothetical protein
LDHNQSVVVDQRTIEDQALEIHDPASEGAQHVVHLHELTGHSLPFPHPTGRRP